MKAQPRVDYRHLYRFCENSVFRDNFKKYEMLFASTVEA